MHELGPVLAVLRSACGLSQTDLARISGVKRSSICDYERGKVVPDASILARLLSAMGLSWSAVDHAADFLAYVTGERAARREPASDEDAERSTRRQEALRLLAAEFGTASARLGRSLMTLALDAVEEYQEREHPRVVLPVPSDRAVVPELWGELRHRSPEEQQSLVRTDPRFRAWALAEFLCLESERLCAGDLDAAIAVAILAVAVAGESSGPPGFRCRLRAFAAAHLGNAWKAKGELRQADEQFALVAAWWTVGPEADPAGLLDEARVLALMASFQVVKRQLAEAEDLIRRALARATDPLLRGRLLVLRARALEETGAWADAITCLTEASPLADPERDPRLSLCIRHNLAWLLANSGRAAEAKALLPSTLDLSRSVGTFLDQVRLLWVAAKIAAEEGTTDRAVGLYLQVRAAFVERNLWLDAALVSLELSALYAANGRTEEVKTLARNLVPVFQANDVHREALAALTLFRQAAEKEEVTVELARRLTAYFHRARFNPELRFE